VINGFIAGKEYKMKFSNSIAEKRVREGIIMRRFFSLFHREKILRNAQYNEDGYYVHQTKRMENPLVTVILPVYNAEKTLQKTIDSIIDQSIGFKNIELIILDDRSTDRSRSVILSYAHKYPNIVPVFFRKNNG